MVSALSEKHVFRSIDIKNTTSSIDNLVLVFVSMIVELLVLLRNMEIQIKSYQTRNIDLIDIFIV